MTWTLSMTSFIHITCYSFWKLKCVLRLEQWFPNWGPWTPRGPQKDFGGPWPMYV